MFLKNTASQYIHAQMNSRTDGSPLTTGVVIAVKVDGGSQNSGGGTLTHIANGLWQYALTQAESNGEIISFQFTHSTGINTNMEVISTNTTTLSDAIKNIAVETQGSYTLQQALSIILAVVAGVTVDSGATLKTPNGAATRVAATIDTSNNRTAMTLSPSS